MRDYPTEDYELKDLEDLNAENWMVEALKMNPDYNQWGNGEDYMWTKEKSGWSSSQELESVDDLWDLDDLNELVNFHFEVVRSSIQCEECDGSGLNSATKKLSDDWYSFDNSDWIYTSSDRRFNNKAWQYHLTEVEIEALVKEGRLTDLIGKNIRFEEETNSWTTYKNGEKIVCDAPEYPSPNQVNEWAKKGIGHDSINRYIAVKARGENLGIYGHCEKCNGKGYIYTEPKAHLSLQMWYLHPRKGASRGVYLKNINQDEFNKVVEYLQEAAKRNADRFSRLQVLEVA